ncbi:hypothetical protein GXP67_06145 [Rhodocytophaga rosea]|uniref:Fibronectin type-III domain-containing protein n=1 Tax=Rhodocytophaga rosea TaxID=2704465 RepID=A0A6C0GEC9_9BACT|nr:FG-GAP-like repeat-containing protein [Rhodocytophaga rosea]QHT66267.1 hypothetical protein GXP67_06145 [Rhodocytophaga rosea]
MNAGGTGDYSNYQYITQTFNPTTSTGRISVTFTSFDTEQYYDYLYIYDGSSTSTPLIGSYSGNTLPPTITATNTSGQLTFYFTSNSSGVKSGWQATISCVILPNTLGNLTASGVSGTQINLSWSDTSSDETGFVIERSTSSTSGFIQIATLSANTTSYANTGLVTDNRYYYRVRSVRNGIYSPYSNVATAALGNAPLLMSNGSFTVCSSVFLDAGGTGNYENNQSLTMTLTPATAVKMLSVSFSSFSTESYYDELRIYDGSTTSAYLIGTYSGTTLPPIITASNATGQLTFQFYSGYNTTYEGWQASISCVDPVPPVLSSSSPLKNSTNVYRYNNIGFSFSQTMQAATASAAAIKIHGSQTGLRTTALGGYFSGAGTSTVTFDPFSDLKPGEVVTVSVTTQAKNATGLAIVTPQVYQFTAAASSAPANFVASTLSLPASPFGVVMADFDKDGDINMASSHHSPTGGVSLRFNNGTGVFSGSTQVATGANSRAILAADFDGDGDMDLATANQLSNTVSVRFNDGTGVFSGTTQVAVGTTPISVTAADFDGDGDMDIATANYGSASVSIRFNNGQGVFSGTTQVAVGVNPSWLQAGFLAAGRRCGWRWRSGSGREQLWISLGECAIQQWKRGVFGHSSGGSGQQSGRGGVSRL